MKIVIVADNFLHYLGNQTKGAIFGGQEILLLETCRVLLAGGHDVSVIQIGATEKYLEYEGINVKQIKVPTLLWFQRFGFIRRWTWAGLWLWPHIDKDADWVHFHNHHLGFPFAWRLRGIKTGMNHGVEWDVPWVYSEISLKNLRDRFAFVLLKIVTRFSVATLDKLITNDYFFVHYTTLRRPDRLRKFDYIPNFPSPQYNPNTPPLPGFRERFPGKKIVLLPKMAMRDRGTDIMFAVLAKLRTPEVVLVVTGTSDAAPQFVELAKTMEVAHRVHFTGHLDFAMLPGVFAAADVVVIPSPCREATAIAMLEGMAMGKPMVISNIGGLPEVAKDQFNSLVRAATPNEFAAAIDLLLQDPALGRRLGRNAAEFVQGAYSKQLWDQRISKFFTYDPGFRDGKM